MSRRAKMGPAAAAGLAPRAVVRKLTFKDGRARQRPGPAVDRKLLIVSVEHLGEPQSRFGVCVLTKRRSDQPLIDAEQKARSGMFAPAPPGGSCAAASSVVP